VDLVADFDEKDVHVNDEVVLKLLLCEHLYFLNLAVDHLGKRLDLIVDLQKDDLYVLFLDVFADGLQYHQQVFVQVVQYLHILHQFGQQLGLVILQVLVQCNEAF